MFSGDFAKRVKVFLVTLVCLASLFALAGNLVSISKVCDENEKQCGFLRFVPRVTLGLDLQGGSQLLLEAQFEGFFEQQMKNVAREIDSIMWDQRIAYRKIKESSNCLEFDIEAKSIARFDLKLFKSLLMNSHRRMFARLEKSKLIVELEKDQEIKWKDELIEKLLVSVRGRIDESGTKEILLQRMGANKILIQVPGVDDPEYIKRMLGKVAKLTFHLVDPVNPVVLSDHLYPQVGYIRMPSFSNPDLLFNVTEDEEMDGNSILDAKPFTESFKTAISFRLNSEGAARFAALTKKNIGRQLAIVIDGKVVTAPVINAAIVGGEGMISGSFSLDEARELASLLRSGALPVPLKVVEERTVGSSLGISSIKTAWIAGGLGVVAVVLFMCSYYRFMGFVASFGLVINLAMAVLVMALFKVTLTLSGVAGLILTLGMSIDANVLIYERMRDEARGGAGNKNRILKNGFEGALAGIIDSNITTILASVTMVIFGSGFIRGFAMSLIIGIVCSLFSAITFTKMIIDYFYIRRGFAIKLR